VVGENRVDLQITCGGGVVALRSLEGAIEMDNGHRQIDTDLLTREIRLTLGQLPTGFREAVTRIKVFGRTEWIQPLADEIAVIAERMGLPVELRPVTQVDGVGALASIPESAPPALVMALRCLEVNPPVSSFCLPRSAIDGTRSAVLIAPDPLVERDCRVRCPADFAGLPRAVYLAFDLGITLARHRTTSHGNRWNATKHPQVSTVVR